MSSLLKAMTSEVQVEIEPFANGERRFTAPLSEAQQNVWPPVHMWQEVHCDGCINRSEIEDQFHQHPGVQKAIVIIGGDPSEVALVSYFIPSTSIAPHLANQIISIRAFLQKQLPTDLFSLKTLPLMENGTIDRLTLPLPHRGEEQLAVNDVATQRDCERLLTAVWAEVLGLDRMGIHDNFFDVGGHSLLAIQIIARMRQFIDVELFLPQFFESPTIAELAKHIEVLQWSVQKPLFSGADKFEEGEI